MTYPKIKELKEPVELFGTCPKCGDEMRVVDSRPRLLFRHRRTKCHNQKCRMQFNTREITQDEYKRLTALAKKYAVYDEIAPFVDTLLEKMQAVKEA